MTTKNRRSNEKIRAAITSIRGRYIATKRDRDLATALDRVIEIDEETGNADGAVIVILSGVETLWDSISFDHQVQRRYSKFELPPVTASTDAKLIWKLLVNFCDQVGLEPPDRGDLLDRIIYAGRKRFGLCIEQMISAIEIALLRGDPKLDATHFTLLRAARARDLTQIVAKGRWRVI